MTTSIINDINVYIYFNNIVDTTSAARERKMLAEPGHYTVVCGYNRKIFAGAPCCPRKTSHQIPRQYSQRIHNLSRNSYLLTYIYILVASNSLINIRESSPYCKITYFAR